MAERDVPKPFPSGDELEAYDLHDDDPPRDPDWDAVPTDLAALDGRQVTISGIDRETGTPVHLDGEVVTVPGLHGDLARRQQA